VEDEDEAVALRAAGPPQAVIDQRTMEAVKVCTRAGGGRSWGYTVDEYSLSTLRHGLKVSFNVCIWCKGSWLALDE